jgi:hypothetical protein
MPRARAESQIEAIEYSSTTGGWRQARIPIAACRTTRESQIGAREDPLPVGGVTQSRRPDHCRTEVVTGALTSRARVHSHPHPQQPDHRPCGIERRKLRSSRCIHGSGRIHDAAITASPSFSRAHQPRQQHSRSGLVRRERDGRRVGIDLAQLGVTLHVSEQERGCGPR